MAQDNLSLKDAIALGLKNNYDITLARTEAEISIVNNTWATAGAYPTAVLGITDNNSTAAIEQKFSNGSEVSTSGVTQSNLQAFVTLNWRVFDGMRMFATKSRLEEVQRSGEVALQQRISQTVFDISMAYYALIRLNQQLKATQQLIELFEERKRIAEARYSVGVSAKNDLLQAQIDLNEQNSALRNVINSLTQTQAALNTLIGRIPSMTIVPEDSIEIHRDIDIRALEQETQQQNYTLLLAQQDLAIALQSRREIYSQGLPSVNISGGYNYSRNSNSAGFSLLNQSNGFNVGIGISVPLFNGLITQTQLDVADLQIQNRQTQIENVRRRVQQSIANAQSDYNTAIELVTLEQKNLALANENAGIALERFKRQTITSVELRQIQYNTIESTTRLLNAQFSAKTAELQLMLLAGKLKVK